MKTILQYAAKSLEPDQYGQHSRVNITKIIEDEMQQQQQQPLIAQYQSLHPEHQQIVQALPPAAPQAPIYHPSVLYKPDNSASKAKAIAAFFGLLSIFLLLQTINLQNENSKLAAENGALKEMAQILRK